ncbi:hypothetical protein [Paracraurococcus lichenis]|uniref:DUF5681 domain-containing protein n=1 Tax=Paracraurococcus lichenis TaxID=3064888 RepID=A0ABT9E8A0_9PROT|nr:hypothetical protein [Paracraurococcus sp. LOR1-02]MDO9712366.1 hypothetical protein [Paracraurococcus sp. LOR1-02]
MAKYVRTGGRKPGTKNKATLEREARARAGLTEALTGGPMPLDVILTVMRGGEAAAQISERQYDAAVAAAPYLHPRLASTTVDATVRRSLSDFTDEELAALAGAADGEDGAGEAPSGPH